LLLYQNYSVTYDLNISVTLKGGYDCDYAAITGETRLNGTMIIDDGEAAVGNFVVN